MKSFLLHLGLGLALVTVPLARGSDGSGDRALPPPEEHFLHAAAVDWKALVPPPPEKGSVAALADLETVLQVQAARTPADIAWVKKTEKDDVFADYAEALGPWFEPKSIPRVADFIRQVTGDTQVVNRKVKDLYPRTRPFKLEPTVQPCVTLPTSNSYPSGHTLRAFVWAGVLADIFPDQQAKFYALAHRIAWGRVQGGAHFPTDTIAARLVAQKVVEELRRSPAYRAAVEQCRAEVAPFLQKKAA